MSATRMSLPADAKSITIISAIVRDSVGKLVEDGTEVQFSASSGIIEESAFTSAGVARVKLTSPSITGKVVVTASWLPGQAISIININITNASEQVIEKRYITIKADDYMAYSIDGKVMDAVGNVIIEYRNLTIHAHSAQVDLLKNRIVARGQGRDTPVTLKSGSDIVTADMFTCDLMGTSGLLISAERGGTEIVDFSTEKLIMSKPPSAYPSDVYDFIDLSGSLVMVRTKMAIIYPGEKIYFKRASIYPGEKRMITLPYYALSLTDYPVDGTQYIGYSSNGISLSVPFYYSLTPTSGGALLLKYGDKSGWSGFGQAPGWFIDLRQSYTTRNSQGVFVLNEITSKDWGAHYSHNQSIGKKTHINFYIDYPAHKNVFSSLNINRSFSGFSMGLDLDGSSDEFGGNSISENLTLQTQSKRLGKSFLSYNLSGATGLSRSSWKGADETSKTIQTSTSRVNTNLVTSPLPLSTNLKLRGSLAVGYQWQNTTDDRNNIEGLTTIGSSVLDWKISPTNSMQLSYRYIQRPIFTRRIIDGQLIDSKPASQSVSASWRFGKPSKWSVTMYGVKGLDFPNMSLFGDVSYRLDSQWRLGLRMTANKYRTRVFENGEFVEKDKSYDDLELSLGKQFGSQEISAVWSRSQGKILLEIGSGSF
ncbi:MAG: hypothetical protein ACYC0V_15900 [Armatimonadota bacterium]